MPFSIAVNFPGNCREAVTFYANVFDQAAPYFLTYGAGDASFDPNVKISEKGKDLIMYTSLDIAGTTVEFNDMPENMAFVRGNSIFLTVTYPDLATAQQIFDRLSEQGQIAVPLTAIPQQGYYGMVNDQFDLGWIVKVAA